VPILTGFNKHTYEGMTWANAFMSMSAEADRELRVTNGDRTPLPRELISWIADAAIDAQLTNEGKFYALYEKAILKRRIYDVFDANIWLKSVELTDAL
jgi:hypothetical protein